MSASYTPKIKELKTKNIKSEEVKVNTTWMKYIQTWTLTIVESQGLKNHPNLCVHGHNSLTVTLDDFVNFWWLSQLSTIACVC